MCLVDGWNLCVSVEQVGQQDPHHGHTPRPHCAIALLATLGHPFLLHVQPHGGLREAAVPQESLRFRGQVPSGTGTGRRPSPEAMPWLAAGHHRHVGLTGEQAAHEACMGRHLQLRWSKHQQQQRDGRDLSPGLLCSSPLPEDLLGVPE